MPASTVLSSIRTPLATAISGVSANVYSYVPEAVQVPAVILVPDSPYLELNTINDSTIHAKINMTITCGVAYLSNPASLDNLEQLLFSVLAVRVTLMVVSGADSAAAHSASHTELALPQSASISSWNVPSILTVL